MVNFGLLAAEIVLGSLGHPSYFQRLPRLGSVIAQQSSSERQPNFAAVNRRRYLCSAVRPSRWALAHISSFCLHKASAVGLVVYVPSQQIFPGQDKGRKEPLGGEKIT